MEAVLGANYGQKEGSFLGQSSTCKEEAALHASALAPSQAKETLSQLKVTPCRRCRQSAADICLQMLCAGVLMQFEARCVLPISQVEIFRRPALVLADEGPAGTTSPL